MKPCRLTEIFDDTPAPQKTPFQTWQICEAQSRRIADETGVNVVSSKKQSPIQITYQGTSYTWIPTAGFIRADGLRVPESLRPILESMVNTLIEAEDDAIESVEELTVRAEQARRQKQFNRVEKLVQKAKTNLGDDNPDLCATLGAVYVERNEIQLAMDEVEPFADMRHAGIQQVIALALHALFNDIPDTGNRMADSRKRDAARKKAKDAWNYAKEILKENGNNGWPEFEILAQFYNNK